MKMKMTVHPSSIPAVSPRMPSAAPRRQLPAGRRAKARAKSGSFIVQPLSLAALILMAGPAGALPNGATVVNGQVTIQTKTPTLQLITQSTDKAIVDWKSFSIAAGEKVQFNQPSSTAVILNRVTGYDPSAILGQMQSNGQVFLLNPYGVVFGRDARVDVGGLVASSLSLSNADFMASRYSLSSNDASAPALRGAVRNEGVITATGGTVVLAGPSVSNTGTIEATGGRVGMVAAQEVLVDVEGDGLLFFQTKATEASNRLEQLGRIQADGGTVEMRAAARGAFADTVLNLGGVIQARTLGQRNGQVVIDGGDAGITRLAGSIDVSGAEVGQQGGRITATGQKLLLDDGARLDASGNAGGGTVLVGGNWHGQGPERNADATSVAQGARVDVSATGSGDGGAAVVWSDGVTSFQGRIDAQGGAQGGNGGQVEVSGKRALGFTGQVDTSAANGSTGFLLLDPSDITIGGAD
jgi:filamentous hemagglutinin family protein